MKREVPKIIVEVDDDLQKRIKYKIADEKITMKKFVIRAMENELKK